MEWEQLKTAGLVIFAALGGLTTLGKAIDVVRGWIRPASDEKARVGRMLQTDKARLDAHEKEISDLREGQRVLCGGLQALLEHELHNGNMDEMQIASKALTNWLLDK